VYSIQKVALLRSRLIREPLKTRKNRLKRQVPSRPPAWNPTKKNTFGAKNNQRGQKSAPSLGEVKCPSVIKKSIRESKDQPRLGLERKNAQPSLRHKSHNSRGKKSNGRGHENNATLGGKGTEEPRHIEPEERGKKRGFTCVPHQKRNHLLKPETAKSARKTPTRARSNKQHGRRRERREGAASGRRGRLPEESGSREKRRGVDVCPWQGENAMPVIVRCTGPEGTCEFWLGGGERLGVD